MKGNIKVSQHNYELMFHKKPRWLVINKYRIYSYYKKLTCVNTLSTSNLKSFLFYLKLIY